MTHVDINLNDSVQVLLNEEGAKIVNAYYDELYGRMPPAAAKHKPAPKVAGDVHKAQLWDIMHIYGPHTFMGKPMPFAAMTIKTET